MKADCQNYVCEYASEFIKTNWDKLEEDIAKEMKENERVYGEFKNFPETVKNNYLLATWVITEVMSWGMDKDYLEEIKVHDYPENGFVIQPEDNTYIKFTLSDYDWIVEFTEPKTKQVVYFE